MRFGSVVVALLALALVGCASGPKQPCQMPGANASGENAAAASGGQSTASKPETGRVYGAPNPTSVYGRGDIGEVRSDYETQSRQAGAIANPKSWSSDVSASASSPTTRAASRLLELIGLQAAALPPGCPAWVAVMDRGQTILAFTAKEDTAYREQLIRMAPSYEYCVLIQTDNAGSSTGGQDAFDPKNAEAIQKGLPELVKASGAILTGTFEDAEAAPSTFPPATAEPEPCPDAPPAGVAVPE